MVKKKVGEAKKMLKEKEVEFESLKERLKDSDSKLLLLEDRVSQLKTEKTELHTFGLKAYEEGFKKVICQTVHFSPSLDVNQFYLDKDVVDCHLVDD